MSDSGADFKLVLREYVESLVIAVILAVILRTFVFTAYKIPSESMLPNLVVGDFIFAYKLPYGVDLPLVGKKWWTGQIPERGAIVVFKHPKDKTVSYVKRVVGLPGDRVEIRAGKVLINDQEAQMVEILPDAPIKSANGLSEYQLYVEKYSEQTHAIMIAKGEPVDNYGPILVPPDNIFVLGDNRSSSDDSRYWGTVPMESVEGQVFMIWMSLDWVSKEAGFPRIRWDRLFKTNF